MSDFFGIYHSIGRRGSFLGETLDVDSNRGITSRGNSHTDKTLGIDVREKVLQARIQEIEAFARDRGVPPQVVFGVAEAALRTGRIPNLGMFGLGSDDAVAVRHFVAGEILNLAGMEAVDWDGTKVEEALNLEPHHQRMLDSHFEGVAKKLADVVRHHHKGASDARHLAQESKRRIRELLRGGSYDLKEDYWHAIHGALRANQNEVSRHSKFTAKDPAHQEALAPHIESALERLHNFVGATPSRKHDTGGEKSSLGVPSEGERRGKHASTGEYGAKRLQQEYGYPSDRNASPVGHIAAQPSFKAPQAGKPTTQGNFDEKVISQLKKAQGQIEGAKPDVKGLTDFEIRKDARALGVLGTEDMDEKRLLNIEPGDPRNEKWPKIGPELQRLLRVESKGLYFGDISTEKTEGIDTKAHGRDSKSADPAEVEAVAGKLMAHAQKNGSVNLHDFYSKESVGDVPMYLAAHHLVQQGHLKGVSPYSGSHTSHKSMTYKVPVKLQQEATTAAAVAPIMSYGNAMLPRPSSMATFSAATDKGTFAPRSAGLLGSARVSALEAVRPEPKPQPAPPSAPKSEPAPEKAQTPRAKALAVLQRMAQELR